MALGRQYFILSKFSNLNSFTKISNSGSIQTPLVLLSVRTTKHYHPKWKWLRSQKVIPVDLPDFDTSTKSSRERMRSRLKELGLMPPRFWRTRPMTITCLSEIIDPYVPPEGDGKASILSKEGAKDLAASLNKKRESFLAVKKIKSYDENFSTKTFPQEAHDLYIKAHEVLMKKDAEELSDFVTEHANSLMMDDIKNKTLRWKFIKSLEPPIIVHARTQPYVTNKNFFAQVTVRFHTQQTLAIYDRFGRLFYGNELVAKDVLEYVVFEKHIVNMYGTWRLHAKIIPDWMSKGEPSARTYRIEEIQDDDEEDEFLEEDQNTENLAETEIVTKESTPAAAEAKS